jgi:hypothetical protein
VVLRVVSLLEVYQLTLVPHLPSGDQTPAHFKSRRFTLIVVPLRLLSRFANGEPIDVVLAMIYRWRDCMVGISSNWEQDIINNCWGKISS